MFDVGERKLIQVGLLPLAPGLHKISGFRLSADDAALAFDFDALHDVLIEAPAAQTVDCSKAEQQPQPQSQSLCGASADCLSPSPPCLAATSSRSGSTVKKIIRKRW